MFAGVSFSRVLAMLRLRGGPPRFLSWSSLRFDLNGLWVSERGRRSLLHACPPPVV
jgi:hypothetical protein